MAARDEAIETMREATRMRADVPDWLHGHYIDALPADLLRRLADEKDALAGREQNPDG
jgi:hypothetical protein